MRRSSLALLIATPLWLAGCDALGLESASALAARKDAEGRAVGGACRHAGRAIEQCYAMNKRADKAAVFAGWREMNDYMRENNIQAVPVPAEAASAPGDGERTAESATPAKPSPSKKGG
jgi:hypothetical protein